ncbi:hypothetical protein AK812_SmicGene16851 [Symbiodinium microadriaticum]|uniref:FH2 domain-containing protein n=1 Tax=Symbiodinium microadriaticum TaxID=2951 RepID=A0A1Q9DZ75_SYMMI|nr:hypothetical protein AK812_SmicGene16851 [Symbiodinium microadriaticum]
MIRLSLFCGLLYSTRLQVNETPIVEIRPWPEATEEFQDEPDSLKLHQACAPLLLSAGLVALAQLRGTSGRARLASGFSVEELRFEDEPRKTTSEASTPCKELQTPSTPTTPSTSTSSPQKGKGGKAPPPPKGLGKGPSKNAAKGPPGTQKGKAGAKGGKGTPPKGGALATQRSGNFEDREGEAKALPFGTRRIRWRTISDHAGTVFDGLDSTAPYSETRKMLHEVLAASVVQQTARPSAFVPKSSGVCLLDRNRAQQLAIAFRRSPLPLQKLCLALQTLDFSVPLSEEEIEGLLKAWPTDVDFRQVAKHEGPTEELRDVEQCIRQDSLSGIFGHLHVLQTACDELMKSEKLQVLLQEEALLLVVRQRHASKKASTTGGPVTEGVRDSTSVVSATADTEQESKEIADEAVTSDSDESTAAGRDADGQVDFDLDVDADAAATSRAWASGCLRTLRALRDVRAQQKARLKLLRLSRSLVEALRIGNYINGDSGAGFALDAFIQLRSLKGVGGATPLHCLCAGCAEEDPAFAATLHTELASLRDAANMSSESPLAPIQPLGCSRAGHPPFGIPPLHLQMIRAEPLSVTFEQSGEEGSSPSEGRSLSPEPGPGSPRRRPHSATGAPSLRTPRTPPMAPRAIRTPSPRRPRSSPQSSPAMSPETLSGESPMVCTSARQGLPLRFTPPVRPPAADAESNRPCMPMLQLPQALVGAADHRQDGKVLHHGVSAPMPNF